MNNHSNLEVEKYKPLFDSFFPYSKETLGYTQPFTLNFISDEENQQKPLGKTAYYDPSSSEITIYTDGRHIKDVLRSIAHELVHHTQNERGEFERDFNTDPGYALRDDHLWGLEQEAYKNGNSCFRRWEDTYKQGLMEKKDMTVKKIRNMVRKLIKEALQEQAAPGYSAAMPTIDVTGECPPTHPHNIGSNVDGSTKCSRKDPELDTPAGMPPAAEIEFPEEDVVVPRKKHKKYPSRGWKGEQVEIIQHMLAIEADGDFGGGTERSVKFFQELHGLEPDGVVGPNTWAKMQEEYGTVDPAADDAAEEYGTVDPAADDAAEPEGSPPPAPRASKPEYRKCMHTCASQFGAGEWTKAEEKSCFDKCTHLKESMNPHQLRNMKLHERLVAKYTK